MSYSKELIEKLRNDNWGWSDIIINLRKSGKLIEALNILEQQPEDGELLCEIGNIYKEGIDVKKDYIKMMKYYMKSNKLGDSLVKIQIGEAYRDGLGVKQDGYKAIEWFQKAYEMGDVRGSACLISRIYSIGEAGVPQNDQLAMEWREKGTMGWY